MSPSALKVVGENALWEMSDAMYRRGETPDEELMPTRGT